MGQQSTPKDASITVNNSVPLVTYGGSFADNSTSANTAIQVFTSEQNTNGAIIELAQITIATTAIDAMNMVTLLAKATAPTNPTDGDIILSAVCIGGSGASAFSQNVHVSLPARVKIPAGKGFYVNQQVGSSGGSSRCVKTILYTLL